MIAKNSMEEQGPEKEGHRVLRNFSECNPEA